MSRTRTELKVKALDKLGVSQAGQDPSAEDVAVIEGYVDPVLDMLAREKVVYVNDRNAIDNEFFLPIATILANAAANDFGGAYDEGVDEREKRKLRILQPRPGGYPVQQVDYF